MKYYTVVADAGVLLAGTFHLTDAQHDARKYLCGARTKEGHSVTPEKTPTHFKKGEVLGFAGEIPKGNTGLEPWKGNFDDRIRGEREAAAAAKEKLLAARRAPLPKKEKAGGLFARA